MPKNVSSRILLVCAQATGEEENIVYLREQKFNIRGQQTHLSKPYSIWLPETFEANRVAVSDCLLRFRFHLATINNITAAIIFTM